MSILWMTSLRPIGKSIENDKIQEIFVKSLENLSPKISLSLTQFDDHGVEDYINKKKIKNFFTNVSRDILPPGNKYSNKIMLENALDQFLENNYEYLVYSTADILVPRNIFNEVDKIKKKLGNEKSFCALVYPNTLKKNGVIKSYTTPHYGIDIFIFKLNKNDIFKFKKAIQPWKQYDWGINDNFYTSVCGLLNLEIYNIYNKLNIIKFENDFKTINENRDWQVHAWKKNQKYFIDFLKFNKLSLLYAYGSYHYLLIKILRISDLNTNLIVVYLKFYLKSPKYLIDKFLYFLNLKRNK